MLSAPNQFHFLEFKLIRLNSSDLKAKHDVMLFCSVKWWPVVNKQNIVV